MNWLKNVMLFRLFILVIQLEKTYYNTITEDIEKKSPKHDKYIPS